jgi:hypothetical protein
MGILKIGKTLGVGTFGGAARIACRVSWRGLFLIFALAIGTRRPDADWLSPLAT